MPNRFALAPRILSAACLLAACAAAQAAPADAAARERYQQDRQTCMTGNPVQGRETCLKEAGAALQAARSGQLTSQETAASGYERNALQRCEVFKTPVDRDACMARVRSGTQDGSVAGGGILMEATTQVPVPPQPGAGGMPAPRGDGAMAPQGGMQPQTMPAPNGRPHPHGKPHPHPMPGAPMAPPAPMPQPMTQPAPQPMPQR